MQNKPIGNGNFFQDTDKKQENYPDWRGDVELTPELVQYIAQSQGGPLTLRLAGWWKKGPKAGDYISVRIEPPMAPKSQTGPSGGRPTGYQKPQPQEDLDDDIPF